MSDAARLRLAVGLDVPSLEQAEAAIEALAGAPGWLKVGAELFAAAGPAAVRTAARSARVFLDLKLHDIPRTVAAATAAAGAHGVEMLTVHAAGGRDMLAAARDAAAEAGARRRGRRLEVVAVTVLTSLGAKDLPAVGVAGDLEAQVGRLVDLACQVGIDGVVASPREAAWIRQRVGPALRIVTPGIRGAGEARDDQSRTSSPGEAIRAGSDLLVVARPVLRAPDPGAAARALVAEIERSLGGPPA